MTAKTLVERRTEFIEVWRRRSVSNPVLAAVLGFDAVLSLSKHTLQRAQLLSQRTAATKTDR